MTTHSRSRAVRIDRRWRGAAFDIGVGLMFAAVVSGPMIWVAALAHRAGKQALRALGVM